jgi:hypothetical protein
VTVAWGGQVALQSLDRPLGLQLLNEGEGRVQRDHDHHGHGHRRDAGERRKRGGAPEQEGQRVGHLPGKLAWPASLLAPFELVGAVAQQAPVGLALGEAATRGAEIAQEEVDALLGVKSRSRPACTLREIVSAWWHGPPAQDEGITKVGQGALRITCAATLPSRSRRATP